MKLKLAILMALAALLCGCPEHTATDLDIVPHRDPVAQAQVTPRGHGRSVHRPGALRPAHAALRVEEAARPRRPTEGPALRPAPRRAPRA